jgi:CRISPR-associated protein Csm4
MKIVELIPSPGTQFHFGEILPRNETKDMNVVAAFPSSDLLFSALLNIWEKVFGEADILKKLFDEQKVQLSSAFYYLRLENKTIRFLPKPVTADLFRMKEHKILKKIAFVSEAIIENGILPDAWLNTNLCTLIDHQFICCNEEVAGLEINDISIYKEVTMPKVKVHTTDKEHTLYNQSNISFMQNTNGETGYYFYLEDETVPNSEKNKLNTVVHLIADEGLGGDRSSGCGLLKKIRVSNAERIMQNNSKFYLSISLSNPAPDELEAFEYYKLTTRGGRMTNDHKTRLKLVNMIAEGAIVNRHVTGRIVDISLDGNSRYLRNGRTFLFPLHSKFETLWT